MLCTHRQRECQELNFICCNDRKEQEQGKSVEELASSNLRELQPRVYFRNRGNQALRKIQGQSSSSSELDHVQQDLSNHVAS